MHALLGNKESERPATHARLPKQSKGLLLLKDEILE